MPRRQRAADTPETVMSKVDLGPPTKADQELVARAILLHLPKGRNMGVEMERRLECHTMPRNATPEPLSRKQLVAIEALAQGLTVVEAAKRAKVGRETVHRWVREDFDFLAALNQTRLDQRRSVEDRLRSTSIKAADNVARAVDEGDLRASLAVLKGTGALAGKTPGVRSENPRRLAVDAHREHDDLEMDTLLFDPPSLALDGDRR